jgi:chaperonin GroEL (HSP60 family)
MFLFPQVGEVTITKDDTLLLKGKGAEKAIAKRVEQIKDQIENSTSEYEKEKMQERMARLASGVAILKVKKPFCIFKYVNLKNNFTLVVFPIHYGI